MPLLILALLASLAVAAPAAAQGPAPSNTVAGEVPPKPRLKLTGEQKARVAQAINGQDTLAKLPRALRPRSARARRPRTRCPNIRCRARWSTTCRC